MAKYEMYTEDKNGRLGKSKGTNRAKMIYDLKMDIEACIIMIEDGELEPNEMYIRATLHDYKHGRNQTWTISDNGKLKEVIES